MKWFLQGKGLAILLIFLVVTLFALGGVYYDQIAVETTTETTEEETTAQTQGTTNLDEPNFVSYDETTRVLVLQADGFRGTITVEFTLNATLDGVDSYQVTSSETYANSYNSGYIGGGVPTVETAVIDQYVQGIDPVDGVAGATITSNAVIEILTALDDFLASLNGGN